MSALRHRALPLVLGLALGIQPQVGFGELSERTQLAVEALLRIQDKDLENNAPLRAAVLRVVAQVGDKPELIPLVAAYGLPGMETNLVQVASRYPESPESLQAVHLILDQHGEAAIQAILSPEQPLTAPLLRSLTASADSRCVPLVEPMVFETNRPLETRRLAVRSLGATPLGASHLLAMLQRPEISSDVRALILEELGASRFPGVREKLAVVVPRSSAPAPTLPAMASLLAMRGDSARGRSIFLQPQVACASCHQVGSEGVDFGPKLTGIGTKLGREGLISSILEPSSGIAFGYEAWRFTLKDGEEWLGLLASETHEEVLVKVAGGQIHQLPSRDIVSREKLATSLMPEGLYESLSAEEFVDLIEYLLSLKAGAPSASR